jgi:hypothetical protein
MNEGHDASVSDEIGVAEDDIETVIMHGVDEAGQPSGIERGRHVDVGAQARASPDDRRLCTEQIPTHGAFAHDCSESREEISDCVGTGHGEGSRKPGRAWPDRCGDLHP